MSDDELIKLINDNFSNDKYEFRYINNYLIGTFLKDTNILKETHYKYAFIKIFKEKSKIKKLML